MSVAISLPLGGCTALLLAIGLGGCGKIEQTDQRDPAQLRADAKRHRASCASAVAYGRLKGLLFDQATVQDRGNKASLDTLADYSTVRMENPVVEGRDAELDITRCRGRFILDIPPGAERGFAGERRLQADIRYTAQTAADGNGFIYQMSGAGPIISKLAAFNLTSVAFQPPPAIDERQGDDPTQGSTTRVEPEQPGRQADVAPEAPAHVVSRDSEPPPRRQAPQRNPTADAAREARRTTPKSSAGGSGEGTIRAFYDALGAGDGASASAQVISEKRARGAFSPVAITRFYGRLPEPIRLTRIEPVSGNAYRVSYRYAAGRSRCNGSAIVSLTNRAGRDYIRSIRALDGC